jgi:hypothetical protein
MMNIHRNIGTSIMSIVYAPSMALILLPLAFVHVPSIGVDHFPNPVAGTVRPEAGVDASIGIVAFTEAVTFVIVEAAVVVTSVGVGEYAMAVTLAGRIALTDV